MVMVIDDIDGKSHKTEVKAAAIIELIVKITPQIIYGLGGIHTHAYFRRRKKFQETRRVLACGQCASGLKMTT